MSDVTLREMAQEDICFWGEASWEEAGFGRDVSIVGDFHAPVAACNNKCELLVTTRGMLGQQVTGQGGFACSERDGQSFARTQAEKCDVHPSRVGLPLAASEGGGEVILRSASTGGSSRADGRYTGSSLQVAGLEVKRCGKRKSAKLQPERRRLQWPDARSSPESAEP